MVVVNVGNQGYYLDGYLKKNLDEAKRAVLHQEDMLVCIIDGRVGSGKSTIGAQAAFYCSDGRFSLVEETFLLDQFEERLNIAVPGDSIVIDEAFALLNKRTTRSVNNFRLLSLLQQARVKKVFIFIILPSIYDLDKNLILNIAHMFIHCYRKPFGQRGQFQAWNEDGMRNLWIKHRDYYDYDNHQNFYGKFTKHFPLDMVAYEAKKQRSIYLLMEAAKKKPTTATKKYLEQRNKYIVACSKFYSSKELGEIGDLHPHQINKIIAVAKT